MKSKRKPDFTGIFDDLEERHSRRRESHGGIIGEVFGDNVPKSEQAMIPLVDISLNPDQPRRFFDEGALESLTSSVRELGVLEPLLVRKLADRNYELLAGERRYRAALNAGLGRVPVNILEVDQEGARRVALVENLLREDLTPVEEVESVLGLLSLKLGCEQREVVSILYRLRSEARGRTTHNVMGEDKLLIVQEVFDSLGKMRWESFVQNRLPILNLPEDILAALRTGKLAYTKAQALSKIQDEECRKQVLARTLAENLSLSSIRKILSEVVDSVDRVDLFSKQVSSLSQSVERLKIDVLTELEAIELQRVYSVFRRKMKELEKVVGS